MKKKFRVDNLLIRLGYLTQIVSLFLLSYIIITHLLNLFSLETYVDSKVFDLNYLRILVAISFLTSVTSLVISFLYGNTKFISFFNISLLDKCTNIFISILLGYFFAINDVPPDLKQSISFVAITCFFILILPSLTQSYARFNFLQYKQFFPLSQNLHNLDSKNNVLFLIVSLFIFVINNVLFLNIAINYLNGNAAKESLLRKVLYLKRVSPGTTTNAEKATIYGYNLGWKTDTRSKVMSSDGELPSTIWTNEQIYFEIPLHLKEGVRDLWILKPKNEDDPNSAIIKSNKIKIKVEPRFNYNPNINDSFFERQVKKIKKFFL